jgi:PIN domain nuclease of toxin-antitoxin system
MNYLVDTHVLLWSFIEPKKLPENIRQILLDEDNAVFYSPINLWEISIKYGLKKLFLNNLTPEEFYQELENSYYVCKEIDNLNIITNYKLSMFHKDPFDRFLIWESIKNDLVLLSIDKTLTQYKKDGLKILF